MKFWEIFQYEFTYQARRPWPWLFAAVILVLSFLMTRDGSVAEVLYSDFYLNSPFSIVKTTVFGTLLWLVMAGAIAGDAAARDVATRMYPLTYTTTITKTQYLGGRFVAALALNALILLVVQVAILLGVYLPGVDAQLIGPFRPDAFLTAYAFISLPNAFAATAIQFWLATQSGKAMAAYFGSFLLVFMGFFVAALLLYHNQLGALLDPIGVRFIVEDIARLWTPVEKNVRLMSFDGLVRNNRLVWLGVGLFIVAVTHLSFRFSHRSETLWWNRFRKILGFGNTSHHEPSPNPGVGVIAGVHVTIPKSATSFGLSRHIQQSLSIAWRSFRSLATSWAGLAMLIAIPLMVIPVVIDQMESNGVPLVPITPRVIAELVGSLSDELSRWVIIPFLIIFFAGELIWRERDADVNEITDAMPGSEWAPFVGKFFGLTLMLVAFTTCQMLAAIIAQTILDYDNLQIPLYIKILFGLQLTDYLLFALLALTIHVVVNQKYVGHIVVVIAFVFIAMSSLFGVEHNLLVYTASPSWSYSAMSGFGASLQPWLWFKLYWTSWAILLAVVGKVFWVRGKESGLDVRRRIARHRFTPVTTGLTVIAFALVLATGAFIFYNTNIRNEYLSTSERKQRASDYEKAYGRYSRVPQPNVTSVNLNLEIYPDERTADIHGTYQLVNRNDVAIDSIHIAMSVRSKTMAMTFDRNATLIVDDDQHGHRIFALQTPLGPGDSLQLDFQLRTEPHGFSENGIDGSLTTNGTYFTDSWLPSIGYQSSRELLGPAERREYGLKARPVIPSVYDVEAIKKKNSPVRFEAVIGTDLDQMAVTQGVLRRSWKENGRSYFHYTSEGVVANEREYGFFSAKYNMHKEEWTSPDSDQTVTIQLFHDPHHTAQLDGILNSVRASMSYYTKSYGPYPRRYLTIVERPGIGVGMHADAGMIVYQEGFMTWNPPNNPGPHDHPYAIVAHEMGHQWNVPYAAVEGAPIMSESVAWYYGMKVVEQRGPEHLQQLLRFMRQPNPFPPIRRGEPLLRGLDPYLSYRRGPFALYALSEYIGDNKVNKALRVLLQKHRQPDASLATTLDLYRELKAATPDSLHYLLHDLFEVNTYWELEAKQASARQMPAGGWEVTLDVQARKMTYDSAGVQSETPMSDWIEVGVYSTANSEPLYLKRRRIQTGRQKLVLNVAQQPDHIGIDPNQLLIDLDPDNNSTTIEVQE